MATAPTLLIGLGGKGSEIIKNVYKLSNAQQRKKLSFVVFDTDVNELKKIKEEAPYMHTIQTSDNMTVGQYLDIDQHARDNWFPVNDILNRKVLTEGAGQVRSISRLAFDATLRNANINELHKAIDDLYQLSGNDMTQSIRVIVASTIAGGTGSGLILPVGLYLRNYLQVHYPGTASIIRGFFILPEIMYNVIPGEAERNNLKCNAYAVVRELDAFLMKGDGSLPDEYKDLKFEVPRVGSKDCDRYDGVMPYDFCFLMDAQQYQSSEKLNSFQAYIDHAAETIYAQSIGPTNARSNSSEDNVIRAICKAGGRNRYCGAGASVMRYPYEDVRNYIALNWANECMSKEWLRIDNAYKKELEKIAKQKSLGCIIPKPERGDFYIDRVNSDAGNNDPFMLTIQNATAVMDKDGFTKVGDKWNYYIDELKKYVHDKATENQEDIDKQKSQIRKHIDALSGEKDRDKLRQSLSQAHHSLQVFNRMAIKATDTKARTMAVSLFDTEENPLDKKEPFMFETWLKDSDGHAIHPCALRYYLYQLRKKLGKEKLICETNLNSKDPKAAEGGKDSLGKIFADYDSEAVFDIPDTEDKKENASQRIQIVVKGKGLFKSYKEGVEELCEIFNTYFNATQSYRSQKVYYEIIKAAIEYTDNLINAYELFYNNFDLFVEQIRATSSKIRLKYDKESGTAANYVCATPACMDKVKAKAIYQGNGMELPGTLTDAIYKKVRQYALQDTKVTGNVRFFDSLCNDTIMQYWRDTVDENYGVLIDLDIISALEKEAEYLASEPISENDKEKHVKDEIEHAQKLALPFIEAPQGEQPQLIKACAYSDMLEKTQADDRAELISTVLKNNGGKASEEIDKREIVFYHAIYGLCAKDLQKFAPERISPTLHQQAGDYFKAYYDLVSQIAWDMNGRGTIITPHIDKTWHLVKNLPDLDEGYQHQQQKNIYKALIYGLLSKKLRFDDTGSDDGEKRYYSIAMDGKSLASELKVSNGTPCDEFYELLDALLINPPIVKQLNEAYNDELEEELNARNAFSDSRFYRALNDPDSGRYFKLNQFSHKRRSLFEIPLIYKYSLPAKDYCARHIDGMYEAIFDLIKEYVTKFTDRETYKSTLIDFVGGQYDLFRHNQATDTDLTNKYPRIGKQVTDGDKDYIDELNVKGKILAFYKENGISLEYPSRKTSPVCIVSEGKTTI